MNIVQRMRNMLDFRSTRHYVVFVLSHEDAVALHTEIGRATGKPLPPDEQWRFEHVPVVAADVRHSYVVGGWDQPRIDML